MRQKRMAIRKERPVTGPGLRIRIASPIEDRDGQPAL